MRFSGALLQDRVALVTGAGSARGLGRAIAELFAHHGARVLVTDIDEQAAARTAQALGTAHGHAVCDVRSRAACEAAVEAALGLAGQLDILVNNAGVTAPLKTMQIDEAEYARVTEINLKGTLLMSQAALPALRARGGAIINMASVSAQRGGGIFGGPHYAAAKAGVLGLTKALAREFGRDQVRVNAICPSYIDTDITAGLMSEETRDAVVAGVPLGRPGHALDVAGCALFLASDLAGYVTGAEIDVNGGSHIH